VKSVVATTTGLPASRHQMSHPRVAIDNVFPTSAAAMDCGRRDESMIELRDVDEDNAGWPAVPRCGWAEMTSSDLPLFLTPLAFDDSDWQLRHVELRKIAHSVVKLPVSYVTYTPCPGKEEATLFSTTTLAFLGRFLYFLYHWKQE